jgi:hypothetical protein
MCVVSENPYGQNPQQPPQPPQNPYGTGPGESPYGEQPVQPPSQPAEPPPYGQQPYADQAAEPVQAAGQPNPYGQNPYGGGAPYAQQPPAGPLGDGLDMYGRPLGTDARPGNVTAAGWITLIFSGLTFVLFAFITFALFIAKDDAITEIDKQIRESGGSSDFNGNDAYGVIVGVLLVITIWCLITCVLAVFAMRRSNVARIMLVISSAVSGAICLLGITSVVSAVPLLACVGVIVLLFTGGSNAWFAGRRRY